MGLIIGLGNNGSGGGSVKQIVVDELPDVGKPNIIYLVPKDEPEEQDAYDEFMWIKETSSWEHLGTTHIDLTNYVSVEQQSFTETQKALARLNIGAASNSGIPELPEAIVLQEDSIETAYGTDYDPYESSIGVVLLDFTNQEKAQARLNIDAYAKPNDGIPKTDLASSVQTSLGKADTALQEHQPLKTINNESIVGSGNIEISSDAEFSTGEKVSEVGIDNEPTADSENLVTSGCVHDWTEEHFVQTGSYDATVAVGLADNLRGDTIVEAEFYKRKTGGTPVGSGIAAIKEVRGKSIVWNQLVNKTYLGGGTSGEITFTSNGDGSISASGTSPVTVSMNLTHSIYVTNGHKYILLGTNGDNTFKFNVFNTTYFSTGYSAPNIITAKASGECNFRVVVTGGATINGDTIFPMLIDLTLMFGAGNEPATVEEFEKMFPLDYYDYNEGEVIPFAGQNLVTTGFNMLKVKGRVVHVGEDSTPTSKKKFSEGEYWNGIAYNGYFTSSKKQTNVSLDEGQVSATNTRDHSYGIGFPVKCEPNTQYYYNSTYGAVGLFDKEGVNVGYFLSPRGVFTTPANAAWMVIIVGRTNGAYTESNLVVNLSNTDRNGTYEPYEKHTLPLDPSQWRDKNGDLVFPYGGMHGVGTAYDYAKVDADGYIRKAVRVFEQVDLGTLNWSYYAVGDQKMFYAENLPSALGIKTTENLVCSQYVYDKNAGYIYVNKSIKTLTNRINATDLTYTDANSFKSANQGVMLYYELAEPVEVELATPIYAKYLVDKDGTEEISPANGSTPYTTMANLSILYAMDARGEIKNLPKNYLSKESAENMLNAMQSAGIIAGYTMTYSNGQYVFTFTKPSA